MVTTHTVTLTQIAPLGGGSKGGYRQYFGVYSTEEVHQSSMIQLSPALQGHYVKIVNGTTMAPMDISVATASTGIYTLAATNATATTIYVNVIGKN